MSISGDHILREWRSYCISTENMIYRKIEYDVLGTIKSFLREKQKKTML